MKRNIITKYFLLLHIIILPLLIIFSKSHRNSEPKNPTLAIFLSFFHPNIHECQNIILEQIQLQYPNIRTIVFNADCNLQKAKKIARSLHCDKNISAIVTLGNLATKVMSQIEQHKPIIYGAILDAESLAFSKYAQNIYGIEDRLDIEQIFLTTQTIIPSIQSVIYLQPNTDTFPSSLHKLLAKKFLASGIKVTEIQFASHNLKHKVKQAINKNPSVIFLPVNPYISAQAPSLLEEILKERIPVITEDASLIPLGACASCSVDYKRTGQQIAKLITYLFSEQKDKKLIDKVMSEPLPQTTTFNDDIIKQLGIKLQKTEQKQYKSIIFKEKKLSIKGEPINTAAPA